MRNDYNYESLQNKIEDIDSVDLEKHNTLFPEGNKYHFHKTLRPCPFEGDIDKARVIILLANPHYQNDLTLKDHKRIDGWGLWGLSMETSSSMHNWWRPRIKSFIKNQQDENEWKLLSHKIASFQSISWASKNYYDCKTLPSRKMMADKLVSLAKERQDLVFIVIRQQSYWKSLLEETGARLVYSKNPRCSYVTQGNIINSNDWSLITSILLRK